jgi:hypothetical protein
MYTLNIYLTLKSPLFHRKIYAAMDFNKHLVLKTLFVE